METEPSENVPHEARTTVKIVAYEPGNGTRYEFIYGFAPSLTWGDDVHFFCAWMLRGGSGGNIIKVPRGGYSDWTYVLEKLDLHSHEDAKAIAHFINKRNCKDYRPREDDLPRGWSLLDAEER